MSYILDALRKAERERSIAQVPTLMTVHETRLAPHHNRLWVISGVCLACVAAIVWFAASFLRPAGQPTPSSSAGASRVQPEAVSESSPVETTPAPPPGVAMPAESRFTSKSQATSTNGPRTDIPQADLPERKRIGDESHTTISRETPSQPNHPESERNAVQQTSIGAGGTPVLPAKNGSPPAAERITTAESSQSKPMSLQEAMAKMKITILLYDETKSERMVFINDRKYVEGDYIDGRYLLESITANGVVLSYQGERALLRASK